MVTLVQHIKGLSSRVEACEEKGNYFSRLRKQMYALEVDDVDVFKQGLRGVLAKVYSKDSHVHDSLPRPKSVLNMGDEELIDLVRQLDGYFVDKLRGLTRRQSRLKQRVNVGYDHLIMG